MRAAVAGLAGWDDFGGEPRGGGFTAAPRLLARMLKRAAEAPVNADMHLVLQPLLDQPGAGRALGRAAAERHPSFLDPLAAALEQGSAHAAAALEATMEAVKSGGRASCLGLAQQAGVVAALMRLVQQGGDPHATPGPTALAGGAIVALSRISDSHHAPVELLADQDWAAPVLLRFVAASGPGRSEEVTASACDLLWAAAGLLDRADWCYPFAKRLAKEPGAAATLLATVVAGGMPAAASAAGTLKFMFRADRQQADQALQQPGLLAALVGGMRVSSGAQSAAAGTVTYAATLLARAAPQAASALAAQPGAVASLVVGAHPRYWVHPALNDDGDDSPKAGAAEALAAIVRSSHAGMRRVAEEPGALDALLRAFAGQVTASSQISEALAKTLDAAPDLALPVLGRPEAVDWLVEGVLNDWEEGCAPLDAGLVLSKLLEKGGEAEARLIADRRVATHCLVNLACEAQEGRVALARVVLLGGPGAAALVASIEPGSTVMAHAVTGRDGKEAFRSPVTQALCRIAASGAQGARSIWKSYSDSHVTGESAQLLLEAAVGYSIFGSGRRGASGGGGHAVSVPQALARAARSALASIKEHAPDLASSVNEKVAAYEARRRAAAARASIGRSIG